MGFTRYYSPKNNSLLGGGRYLICRHPSKNGTPAGFCNRFRVSTNTLAVDLAKALEKIEIDWHWVMTPSGERRSKQDWLDIANPTP